ncbi:MAG TPA: TolC family protein [Rhizomicrobium sp.]|jgi:NodT family efflux transporter outer membrane factor (OMF) lipoprotein|nr:TolC family protein [Rhizomicrobium sp.]
MNIRGCFPVSVFVALIVCGCAVGPDYHAPELPAGSQSALVNTDAKVESVADTPDAWWRLYSDPKLNTYILEAFRANRDLAAARANLASARAVLDEARAGRLPDTDVHLSGTYGRDPATDEILELGGHRPRTTWILEDLLSLTYELDLFGHVTREIEEAKDEAQAAAAARDTLRAAVAAETAKAYVRICTLGIELAVARQSADVTAHEAQIASDRHEAGANSLFDVVRTQGLAASTRADVPELDGERKVTLYELTALLGRTPQNAPVETLECTSAPQLAGRLPVGDGASLLRRRPDVREAERDLAAATARIGVATADLYPRISLTGFYGGVGTNLPSLSKEEGLAWGVGPSISWAFPNQSAPRARVREAEAGSEAALDHFDAVVLKALQETEQALARYRADLDSRGSLDVAQTKADKAYHFAHDAFLSGSITTLDVLTSEEALVSANSAVAKSDAAIADDQIALFQALGGGWMTAAEAAK